MKLTTEPHDADDGNIFDSAGNRMRIVIENKNAFRGKQLLIKIPVEDVDAVKSKTTLPGAKAALFEIEEDDGSHIKLKRDGNNWIIS